jgi:predicted transcriptional regulator
MYRNCDALETPMKSRTLPPLRVSPELRREVESMLEDGQTISSFVLDAVARRVEAKKAQQAFIERGLASSARARKSGRYIPAATVTRKLKKRLSKARAKRAG